MRKAPTRKTIKKLFALSGNLCAFTDCKNNIVDMSGNLIGQICHIEAAEEGGERYNPKQTDTQRASFENLILFCANDHIVTNDVQIYTVDVLKEMKQKHESKFLKKEYKVNEKVIEQAIQQVMTQSNVNSGTGQQNNYQAHQMTVNNSGMTATDVIAIVQSLYDANFPKLVSIAKEEAAKNVAMFENNFREEVSKKLSPEQLVRFSDPDIQVALYQAVQSSARKDSDILRKMLSNLVVQRVKNDENELKQKVLNEAIPTIAKLTKDHLKILTLCFIIKHSSLRNVRSWDGFKVSFERSVKPFVTFKGSQSEVLHLQYAGCGKVDEVFSYSLTDEIKNNYTLVFQNKLTVDEINSLGIGADIIQGLLTTSDTGVIFNATSKQEFEKVLKERGIDEANVTRLANLYEQKLLKAEEIKTKLETELPWTVELFERFHNTPLSHLTLTPVGMAIAIAYYEQVVGHPLDIDIWIN